jgi:UDP-glucose 4-epimerase
MSTNIVFITGAGGFIGKHLSKFLMNKGYDVHGLLLPGEKNEYLNKRFVGDIQEFDELKSLVDKKTKCIYHLAAIANIQTSVKNPRLDFYTNTIGTFNMLELARTLDLHAFVLASTVSVLDSKSVLPINENANYEPSTPYGASKMGAEAYCKAYYNCYNVPTKIIRMFNVYGPGRVGLVVYDLIKKLLSNHSRLVMHGDGKQIRDFLFIDDVVSGFQLVSEKGKCNQVYHIGSGKPISILSLANIIIKELKLDGVEIETTGKNYKGEMLKWYADTSKINKLGFTSRITLKEGIKKTIDWIKNGEILI